MENLKLDNENDIVYIPMIEKNSIINKNILNFSIIVISILYIKYYLFKKDYGFGILEFVSQSYLSYG